MKAHLPRWSAIALMAQHALFREEVQSLADRKARDAEAARQLLRAQMRAGGETLLADLAEQPRRQHLAEIPSFRLDQSSHPARRRMRRCDL